LARHFPTLSPSERRKQALAPSALGTQDLRETYQAYFDDVLKGPAKTLADKTKTPVRGSELLGVIGDPQVARATADALFRDDPRAMIPLIQEAINATLPEYARREPDGKFGSGTLSSLQYLSQDKNRKRKYLDSLSDFRNRQNKDPGDRDRHDYFRFRD
jgi:hypothetical protein